MPKQYIYSTPMGNFRTARQAATALGADLSTIHNRCASDPEHYKKLVIDPRSQQPVAVHTNRVQKSPWPCSWAYYRELDLDTREQVYNTWCKQHSQQPESESAVNMFFDQMDAVTQSVPK